LIGRDGFAPNAARLFKAALAQERLAQPGQDVGFVRFSRRQAQGRAVMAFGLGVGVSFQCGVAREGEVFQRARLVACRVEVTGQGRREFVRTLRVQALQRLSHRQMQRPPVGLQQ
jgi:hypothetical protein